MSRVWLFNARRYTDKNGVDNCSVSYIPLDMGEPDTATSRGGLATVDHKLPGRVFDQLTSAPAVYEIVAYQEQVTWVCGGHRPGRPGRLPSDRRNGVQGRAGSESRRGC
jgi:hypothetical protein